MMCGGLNCPTKVVAHFGVKRRNKMICANCLKEIEKAKKIIKGGFLDEEEWVCSDKCYDEHIEKGCPFEGKKD